jgi:3-oxoacyl-[acyl-carrier-protein] synthase II
MDRGIVITGIGVVSPIGVGKNDYWNALFQGTTGFRPITLFDPAAWNHARAAEIAAFDPLPLLGKKGLRDLDRSTRLLSSAARLALDDCGIPMTDETCRSMGVSAGATYGSLHSISEFDRSGLIEGPRSVNPSHFPNTVLNSPASQVSIRFKIKGFNTTVSTGFCASLDALCYAADQVRLGRSRVVLAGGVEELCEESFTAFHGLGWLSGYDGSQTICCPFDARRNGMVLGEGSAVMVLEDEEHASRRGAVVAARILGYANACSALSEPSFERLDQGLEDAIRGALREASLVPGAIDHVCAAANSSPGLDRMETRVLKRVFGSAACTLPVSSIKSMIGETCSASGALAIAAAAGALQHGMLPPTMNYRDRDPHCDLDHVPLTARRQDLRTVLVLAVDPYGASTAVVLGRQGA